MRVADCFGSQKPVQSCNYTATTWKQQLVLSLARSILQDGAPSKPLLRAGRAGSDPPERGSWTQACRYISFISSKTDCYQQAAQNAADTTTLQHVAPILAEGEKTLRFTQC